MPTAILAQVSNTDLLKEMNRRFGEMEKQIAVIQTEQKLQREYIDKRFEQIDKRFEQIDKRFELIQQIMLALLIAVIGSPFLAHYLNNKKEASLYRQYEEHGQIIAEQKESIERFTILFKNLAKRDEHIAKELKNMGLT